MLASLKAYLNIGASDTSKDTLLNTIIGDMQLAFTELTHTAFDSANANMCSIVVQMSIIEYNRLGTQGMMSDSYSGSNESYLDDLPAPLRKRINQYRKVRVISNEQA